MSFLRRLFGAGGGNDQASEPAGEAIEHKGFRIQAIPFKEGGQYQVCGLVSKEIEGVEKQHRFIRADRFPGLEDAAATTLRKGRQIVDEQGDRLFD